MKITVVLTAVLLSLICGCSGSDKKTNSAGEHKPLVFSEDRENNRFDNTDVKRQVFDMNNDGHVDLWKFYTYVRTSDTEGEGDLAIARKELDVNFDGRVDRIMYYNQKEELVREEIDTDFNGYIDRIHYYDHALIVKTEFYQRGCNQILIDSANNPDVSPNFQRFYRQGVMTREEIDERCDGASENVTIFDSNGNIAQIGNDVNEDGIIEEWIRY